MKFALIKNGVAHNVVVADQAAIDAYVSDDDYKIRIDNLSVVPGVGWLYDGSVFTNYCRLYALVNADVVTSITHIHNENLTQAQADNQYVVMIEDEDPMPEVDWTYDNGTGDFTAPP